MEVQGWQEGTSILLRYFHLWIQIVVSIRCHSQKVEREKERVKAVLGSGDIIIPSSVLLSGTCS